ncbi:molybdate ABC transporter permease subunit [Fodinibius salsisoli]|uniref:Molybdenum transport system permease n=1 Tax=Fodinibius salsisoli TaxID=2820877 RepID=A0ABT3PTJ6_9BACT|nr:molybdate ABC transporter permease subunit [Fodinibius salsisoli]MCW9709166.1 molybdate ABC transporter permease subunit [Fodinibius salsisoli]
MTPFWDPFLLSLQLAAVTTVLLLIIALPICYGIFFYSNRSTPILKSLVSLPLVLPPTVLGYYLLIAFRPEGLLANIIPGTNLAFSFEGLVAGSIIFSFPFMANPILSALESTSKNLTQAAFTLGKSKFETFFYVLLPNIKPSVIIGAVMAFAHTIGEFGMVLMIGGNIPDETRVASIAIYNEVEKMSYANADLYALVLLFFSMVVLLFIYGFQYQQKAKLF